MAQTKAFQRWTYPLPAYNYRVTVGEATISFAEVSGLGVEYQPVTYKHGFSFVTGEKIIPGMRQPIRLTMKKGIGRGKDALQKWFDRIYRDPLASDFKRDIQIDLCDEKGESVVRWTVKQAMPVKIEAPRFDANSNDVAIKTMEVIAHEVDVVTIPTIPPVSVNREG